MCVRLVADQFVLRFTFLLAFRFGLPRPASLVIHRPELCNGVSTRSIAAGHRI